MISDIINKLESGMLKRSDFEEYTDRKEEILEELRRKTDIIFLKDNEGFFYCNIFENNIIAIINIHGLDVIDVDLVN